MLERLFGKREESKLLQKTIEFLLIAAVSKKNIKKVYRAIQGDMIPLSSLQLNMLLRLTEKDINASAYLPPDIYHWCVVSDVTFLQSFLYYLPEFHGESFQPSHEEITQHRLLGVRQGPFPLSIQRSLDSLSGHTKQGFVSELTVYSVGSGELGLEFSPLGSLALAS